MKQFIQYLGKHFRQSPKKYFCLIMLCTLCCTAFLGCSETDPEAIVILSEESEESRTDDSELTELQENTDSSDSLETMFSLNAESSQDSDTKPEEIYVYVCGCVRNPDVYCLPSGSRICDAIEAAGGFLEEASEDYWNLAEILSDGDMIYIPSKEEAREREVVTSSAKALSLSSAEGMTQTPENEQKEECRLVNINLAGNDLLMTLPGIGEARAASIIAYREAHGNFQDPADLMNVSGIGDALFDKIKSKITVQ